MQKKTRGFFMSIQAWIYGSYLCFVFKHLMYRFFIFCGCFFCMNSTMNSIILTRLPCNKNSGKKTGAYGFICRRTIIQIGKPVKCKLSTRWKSHPNSWAQNQDSYYVLVSPRWKPWAQSQELKRWQ